MNYIRVSGRVSLEPLHVMWKLILPFRSPKSAEAYREIWTDAGSPLLVHGQALCEQVQARLAGQAQVALAMRYGSPSIRAGLDARDARLVDMRASPYDLTKLTARQRRRHDRVDRDRDQASINKGFDLMVDTGSTGDEAYNNEEEERGEGTALFDVSPICVESREGRAEYQRLQEELYRRAIPLRRRLIGEYRTFLAHAASLPLDHTLWKQACEAESPLLLARHSHFES